MAGLSLPLLQTITVASGAAVGPAIPLLAAAAFAGAMCCLRAPRSLRVPHGRRAGALQATLAAMAFLAVLPAVIPYDHLLPGAHNEGVTAEATHEQHCHASPASCADAPVAAGLGQFIFSDPLVIAPAMLVVLIALAIAALRGISPRPPTRPPRTASPTVA
ncbi:MAG TPA: hypothetical protein VEZ14_08835 [Dehalococcoidia bacterium]|nr:hypothetical protein [Dehalococcoidia bacterium]